MKSGKRSSIRLEPYAFSSQAGREPRRELLAAWKDRGGMKHQGIARLPEFSAGMMNALGSWYRHEKARS